MNGLIKNYRFHWIWLCVFAFIMVFFLHEKPVRFEAENAVQNEKEKAANLQLIVIDPGHGGTDPGACHGSIMEKDINLAVAQRVAFIIAAKEYPVQLTRETDMDFVKKGVFSREAERQDLRKRVEFVRKVNGRILVSIHVNSGVGTLKGAEVYYDPNKWGCQSLALLIQDELNKVTEMPQKKPKADTFYLFNNVDIPAVIVETGWLCNSQDRELLQNPEYQEQLARAIANGIIKYAQAEEQRERTLWGPLSFA